MQLLHSSVLVVFLFFITSYCQATDISRTPWTYIRGPSSLTTNPFPSTHIHGAPTEFTVAVIPAVTDNWLPCVNTDSFCKSGEDIRVNVRSRLPGCWNLLDFAYFQTFVTIPEDLPVNTFSIHFTQMDDGAQIYIYNDQYPDGILVPGSLVQAGGSLDFNFASTSYISTGENRLVIVQVDDCATANNILAVLTINGLRVCPACIALNQCHVGVCDTTTGLCSNPSKLDNTPCDDGNLCTQTDVCTNGGCVGSNIVTCSSQDQCHDVGVCDPSTGTCSNPLKDNDTPCDDGNACTHTDICEYGVCYGDDVVCSASNQCHDVGFCDSSTGVCSNIQKANNTPCEDGNACTQDDVCQSGVCTSGPQKCCHTKKGCGLCVNNCGNNYPEVLSFFKLTGIQSDISGSGGGGGVCPGTVNCCIPKNQTTSYYSDDKCTVLKF